MRFTRSLATLVAVAGLGGSALALGAPALAANVAGPDVTGTVTANGVPAPNVFVGVYGVNPDGSSTPLDGTDTNAAGQFSIDFDADGVTATQTSYKIEYFDDRPDARGQLAWETQYSGNKLTLKSATPIPAATTGPTSASINLPVLGGIQGTVSVPAPAGYYYYGSASVFDVDGNEVDSASFNNDPTDDTSDPTDGQLSYEIRDLLPGTYRVMFTADAVQQLPSTSNNVPDEISYIGSYYGDKPTLETAKTITVTNGAFTPGINGALTNTLSATQKPSIKGVATPGHKVKADNGTWTLNANAVYTYQWLVNGKLKSTDSSYKIKKHDYGKKLQLLVTNTIGDNVGTVAAKKARIGLNSKYKAKARAVYVHGKRVVQVAGSIIPKKLGKKTSKPGGKVTVYEVRDGKIGSADAKLVKVGKAKVAKNGSFTVTVKGATAGKHVYEVVYGGTKKIAARTSTEKVKV